MGTEAITAGQGVGVAVWLVLAIVLLAAGVVVLLVLRGRDRVRLAELVTTLGTTQQTLDRERQERAGERSESASAIERLDEANEAARREVERLNVDAATLRERAAAAEREATQGRSALQRQIDLMNQETQSRFDASASRTLQHVSEQFAQRFEQLFDQRQKAATAEVELKAQAFETLVRPISETLAKTDAKLNQIDADRQASAHAMEKSMQRVGEVSAALEAETRKLVSALREPNVRGTYGEIQLKKVAELAGMRAYCDFAEQDTTRDPETGRALRPDMVVRLPSGREVAIDAKANLKPYLDALEASNPDDRARHLAAFAEGVAKQASSLSKKGYWSRYEGSPEFVVMFVPGDQFVDAALSLRPDLLEFAASQRVLLASPSTLIGLLRAVHVGFQERKLAEDARQLHALGREMHERMSVALGHVDKLGSSLNGAVEHFNKFVGSYESRLLPTLRKFEDAGAAGARALAEPERIASRAETLSLEFKPASEVRG
jgi:DNA recombination protein RmuC